MSNRKTNKRAEPPCGELCPDDGIDPRSLFCSREQGRRDQRKDRQLCKQAFQVFCLLVEQLSAKDGLQGVYLLEVTPAPDATRLRVGFDFYTPRTLEEALAALEQLRGFTGWFRRELGGVISRKRVPELVFELAEEEEHHVEH